MGNNGTEKIVQHVCRSREDAHMVITCGKRNMIIGMVITNRE